MDEIAQPFSAEITELLDLWAKVPLVIVVGILSSRRPPGTVVGLEIPGKDSARRPSLPTFP